MLLSHSRGHPNKQIERLHLRGSRKNADVRKIHDFQNVIKCYRYFLFITNTNIDCRYCRCYYNSLCLLINLFKTSLGYKHSLLKYNTLNRTHQYFDIINILRSRLLDNREVQKNVFCSNN